MNICPVEVELLHADRQADMTKAVVALHNFANASKTNNSCNKTNK